MELTWRDEMVALLRTMVNDAGVVQTYDDARLEKLIVVAARHVSMELRFVQPFQGFIKTVDIVPDPTADETRDEYYINLTCLQAACILDRGSAAQAAGQAIMIRDGSSQIDLREAFKAKLALLAKGWCAVYESVKDSYLVGQVGSVTMGLAVMSPFRTASSQYLQNRRNDFANNQLY